MTTEATCQQPLLLPFNGHYLGERGSTSSILSPLYYLLLKRTSWDWWNGFCMSDVLPTTQPSVLKHRREHKPHPFFIHDQMEKVLFLSCLLSGWLGSRAVSMLDSGAVGPGFKSQLRCCQVTVLGKLFTPIVRLFTKQRNW